MMVWVVLTFYNRYYETLYIMNIISMNYMTILYLITTFVNPITTIFSNIMNYESLIPGLLSCHIYTVSLWLEIFIIYSLFFARKGYEGRAKLGVRASVQFSVETTSWSDTQLEHHARSVQSECERESLFLCFTSCKYLEVRKSYVDFDRW